MGYGRQHVSKGLCILRQTSSYCTPDVLISLKFSPVHLTSGLSSHHYHPEFGVTLQYDMANGLAIDLVRGRMADGEQVKREHLEGGRVWRTWSVSQYRMIVQETHNIQA